VLVLAARVVDYSGIRGKPVSFEQDRELRTCFVGVLVPDEPAYHGPAFSRAALMFQEGLLGGLASAGLPSQENFGIVPTPALPRGRNILGEAGRRTTRTGLSVRLLPFVNVQPFKWLTCGIAVFLATAAWSWRNRNHPRAIQCLNLTMPPGLFVWIAARLTGSRAVAWVLDVFEPGGLVADSWFRRWDFALQRWLLPRFDGIMVVSRAIADDFVPGRRVCLIDGGVFPDLFGAPPAREAASDGVFRIVLAGSLEAYNGVELALDALQYLPCNVELVIAGTGSLAQRAREVAASDSRLVFRGYLDFDELLRVYRSADLLLNVRMTRSFDTKYFFPSKLMELLASGTPVLSTCAGHIAAVYGDVLYLLPEETPQTLASRVVAIAAEPAERRRSVGARARELVLTQKTWEQQGRAFADYIRSEVFGEDIRTSET
jgi:glycosyltransferase involved in cell wall biosynthesis